MAMSELERIGYEAGFEDGTRATLEQMADIFEGVEDTDLWKETFGNE